ncbi:MAG: hypothetical protein K0S33_2469 [Bacteroidetes bacterium]|jgi:hypothetical protein|nr:hypothetical protein [Bacteroidota bacterium]
MDGFNKHPIVYSLIIAASIAFWVFLFWYPRHRQNEAKEHPVFGKAMVYSIDYAKSNMIAEYRFFFNGLVYNGHGRYSPDAGYDIDRGDSLYIYFQEDDPSNSYLVYDSLKIRQEVYIPDTNQLRMILDSRSQFEEVVGSDTAEQDR